MNSNLTGNPTLARKLAQEDAAKIHYSQKPAATITDLQTLEGLVASGQTEEALFLIRRLANAAKSR